MTPEDIAPIEKWAELEDEIFHFSGLNASVYNTDGIRIIPKENWNNELCPRVKGTPKGQAFICAVAHMNLANEAAKTKQAVIEECDGGLLKIVLPIFAGDQYVGAVGGCGLLAEDGEVDSFMINKTTEIPEEEIEALAATVGTMTREKAEETAQLIKQRLDAIIAAYESRLD